jgi:capsular polysaccharide export protein
LLFVAGGMTGQRTFLFLQGLASPFFSRLARNLRRAGHKTLRVNVCGLDWASWRGSAVNFRRRPEDWPEFISYLIQERRVTDLVVFGDCRPFNQIALKEAQRCDIRRHVFEEGYVRPHWVTLEKNSTNGFSSLPRDPEGVRQLAARTPDPPPATPVAGSFFNRAVWDVAANIVGTALWPVFPHYVRHWTEHPFLEYAGWLGRFARMPVERRRDRATIANVVGQRPYYFLPLQLHSDYQIRAHSPFVHPSEAIAIVVKSFARHADARNVLLLKLHPLDNGLFDYRSYVERIAEQSGVAERVKFISDGPLDTIVKASLGVVLVNSSVGQLALQHGRPVKTLGRAIYDMPGLTAQCPLDEFWVALPKPDDELVADHRKITIAHTQINGGFFTPRGIDLAVKHATQRMLAGPALESSPVAAKATYPFLAPIPVANR